MLTDALFLIAGLALILKGGDLFVSAAVRIAEFLRMPRVVIGSTLVSLATTMPELAVSVMAGLKGESELALGNAVGSCICNVGLIMGVTAAFKHVDIHPMALRIPLWAMFAFGALLFVMSMDLVLSRWQGVVLVTGGVAYFAYDFVHHARDRKPADLAEAARIEQTIVKRAWVSTPAGTAVQFLLGAGVVLVGSRWLVSGAVGLAGALGIPSIVIGLTVIAIGTSLPELVTAVTSSRKAVSDLAVGNVLGANIANLSLIVGTAAILSDVIIDRRTQLLNFPAMLIMFVCLLWALLTGKRVTRSEGVALMALYALYLAVLVAMTGASKG